jgi:hypothetical protein
MMTTGSDPEGAGYWEVFSRGQVSQASLMYLYIDHRQHTQ